MALEYDRHNASSGANSYYERPATIALLGEVSGKRVLEVGCGTGPVTEWLVEHGATVVACDVSAAMVEIARSRVGDSAELHHHDLTEPLTFLEDASVDLVVASLVFHYLRDWVAPLRELHRVLRPTGSVVMSIHHPAWDWRNHCPEDYFAFLQVSEVWVKAHSVTFWRRPLTAATDAVSEAGFFIDRLVEARPKPELEIRDPSAFQEIDDSALSSCTYACDLHSRTAAWLRVGALLRNPGRIEGPYQPREGPRLIRPSSHLGTRDRVFPWRYRSIGAPLRRRPG